MWNFVQRTAARLWGGFARVVGTALDYCVRSTNPRHAISFYLAFNAVATLVTFAFATSWPDFFTIASYWVTSTGFLLALIELYRTRIFTDAVREAVFQENSRQRGFHYRHCLERASSVLKGARQCVQDRQWAMAVARLDDLSDYLSYVNSISPAADDRWREHVRSTQEWASLFGGGATGKRHVYNEMAWRQFLLSVLEQLDDELAPFQHGEGIGNDLE